MTLPRLVALGLVVALASGCASGVRPEALQAWVGRPAAALEKDWGPPTREVQDGEMRILIYEEVEKRASSAFQGTASAFRRGATQADTDETYRSPTIYVRSYLFWVNREGTIVQSARRTP